DYQERAFAKGWKSIPWLRHYVLLSYQDAFGDFENVYYSFSPFDSGINIDAESWGQLTKLLEAKEKISVDAGGEKIMKYIEANGFDYQFRSNQLKSGPYLMTTFRSLVHVKKRPAEGAFWLG